MFQFQYGAIKRFPGARVLGHHDCFNSNMVRLREEKFSRTGNKLSFQFQYGAIKRLSFIIPQVVDFGFNSNMVRLRATSSVASVPSQTMFQFQYGAIKS